MHQTPEKLWLAFETLASTYPHDDGVKLTAHLARWLIEERQRLQVPVPPVLVKAVEHAVRVQQLTEEPAATPAPVAGVIAID